MLAHPAGHSISPTMHNAAFEKLGINAHYEALDVPPDSLEAVVAGLRQKDVYGANVTIPHKLAVLPLMDALSEAAKQIGAVNTIVNEEGKLHGHNTDATGFLRALRDDGQFSPKSKRVVMLGAGGAARAVAYALLKAGVADLGVYNRTESKAETLVNDFSPLGAISHLPEETLNQAIQAADLLVNTTSVGMEKAGLDPKVSPLKEGNLPARGFVSDLVYRPETTQLMRDAMAAGLKVQNGLPMLVYQGAESFECWTGQSAPAKVMLNAAKTALGRARA